MTAFKRKGYVLSIAILLFIEVAYQQKLQNLDACDTICCRLLFVMYTWKMYGILPEGGFCLSLWYVAGTFEP